MTTKEIYNTMKSDFAVRFGYRIDDDSVCGYEFLAVSSALYELYLKLNETIKQFDISTAYGEGLDNLGAELSVTRSTGVPATGQITLTRQTGYKGEIVIPAGYKFLKMNNIKLAYTTDEENIMAESENTIDVDVTAVEIGKKFNIPANEKFYLLNAPVGISSAGNQHIFVDGEDYQNDDDYRAMIIDTYSNINNGVNKQYYETNAIKVSGITTANAVSITAGNINIYVSNQNRSVDADVITECSNLFAGKRALGTVVTVNAAQNKTFDFRATCAYNSLYKISDVNARIQKIIKAYFDNLHVGQNLEKTALEKIMLGIEGLSAFSIAANGFNSNNTVVCANNEIIKLDHIYLT